MITKTSGTTCLLIDKIYCNCKSVGDSRPYEKLKSWSAINDTAVSRIPDGISIPTHKSGRLSPRNTNDYQATHNKVRHGLFRRAYDWVLRRQPVTYSADYHHSSSSPHLLRVFHGLEEGETEHSINDLADWPGEWKWRSTSVHHIGNPDYTIYMRMSFKDLPLQLQHRVLWGVARRSTQEKLERVASKKWEYTVYWNDVSKVPMWRARIRITGPNPQEFLKMEPRKFLTPKTVTRYVALYPSSAGLTHILFIQFVDTATDRPSWLQKGRVVHQRWGL